VYFQPLAARRLAPAYASTVAASPRRTLAPLLLALAGLVLLGPVGGCSMFKKKQDKNATPEVLYKKAHDALKNGSYQASAKYYETLEARFPFANDSRQGRLDIMYAYYKAREKEQAIDAADQFIRENPTHPRVDYAYYVKGLVYFERTPNSFEHFFNVNLAERPPQDARKSFEAFGRVLQLYPNSEYAPDAHQRMLYLRNRLCEYEIHVARYYLRRGGYVAALNRAKGALESYQGAPATRDALEVMATAYHRLGLEDLAAESERVLHENFPSDRATVKKRPWWRIL
jgi:outer membrane protein assembly factor BamD